MVRALVTAGYSVDVICLRRSGEPKNQVVDGANIYEISLDRKFGSLVRYIFEYGMFTLLALFRATTKMIQRNYRVVQVCNLPDTLIFAALGPKVLGARILFDAHDCTPEALMLQKGLNAKSFWVRLAVWMEQLALAIADGAVTASDVFKNLFIQRGACPDKISVIMNLPDLSVFFPKPANRNGFKSKEFVLVYAGTIAPRYGLQTAIRALPMLSDIPGLRLRIIGPGNYSADLLRIAEDLGVIGQVSIEEPVPYERIIQVYHEADVGICISTGGLFGTLGFSTKVAEYMACGLPVIVSRVSAFARYYVDSQVSFCEPDDPVSFANCVRQLYANPDYARKLSNNGLQWAKTMNWQGESERYLDIVRRLYK